MKYLFKQSIVVVASIFVLITCSDMGEPEILLPEITLTESVVNFSTITMGTSQNQSLLIVNTGLGALEGELSLEQDSLSFSLSPEGSFSLLPNDTLVVQLTFSPGSASSFTGSILIVSNDPVDGELTLPLNGTGTAELVPVLTLSDNQLDFGTLLSSENVEHQLTLMSTGTADLLISSIDIDQNEFQSDAALPMTLTPGSSQVITLTFTPGASGEFTAAMAIHSNSVSSPQSVALSGNAETAVSYAADVQPVWNSDCTGCHGSSAGLNLNSYAQLMAGGNSGPSVVVGEGENSRIIKKLRGTAGSQMPLNRTPLSDATIDLIVSWIDQGALNN